MLLTYSSLRCVNVQVMWSDYVELRRYLWEFIWSCRSEEEEGKVIIVEVECQGCS